MANNRIEIAFSVLSLREIKAISTQPTELELDWAGMSLAIFLSFQFYSTILIEILNLYWIVQLIIALGLEEMKYENIKNKTLK